MLWISAWTQPDFRSLAASSGVSQLVTIHFSHYVEFSRWCLQYKGKEFAEHGYAPGQHILPTLRLRLGYGGFDVSSSSRMVTENESINLSEKQFKKKGATAVPVLVTPKGQVLRDSWEIAEYAGFEPVDRSLMRILDEELGPLSRQLCYAYVLKKKNSSICNKLFQDGSGMIWKLLYNLGVGYFLKKIMISSMRCNDEIAVSDCRDKLKDTFSKLSSVLKTKNTAYLGGESPGAADFALAALASPVVSADDYCLGRYGHLFAEIERNDPEYLQEIRFWRNTDVGKHCLIIYQNFRRQKEEL